MGEEADVGRYLVSGRGEGGEGAEDVGIEFAGIGLARNREDFGKSEILGDKPFQLFHFSGVIVEESEEGGLGAGSPFSAEKREGVDEPIELLSIQE